MQLRYAAGVKEMLEQFFTGQPFDEDNYIVKEGELSSQYKWILCKQQQWIKVSMLLKNCSSATIEINH